MKIALVVHDFDPRYGQGRYAVELARRLAPAHELDIYANRFVGSPPPNVTFQKVAAWRATALTTVLTFVRNAERLLAQRHHDLIHAQGLSCWQADIITAHICNAARYRRTPATGKGRLFPALVCPLERRFYQQPRGRHVIAISQQVAGEIQNEYAWKRNFSVVYHGTDTTQFRPPADAAERLAARTRYGLEATSWTWLFAGEAIKGLRQAIEQLPHFPAATLLVISRSTPTPFLELATQLGVAARVRWHGPDNAIWQAYRAADVFIYPSDYDAFGLVVAEAMASELPVVVGRGIGAAEWVEDRRNGLLCDPQQAASVRDALQWLQGDAARARAVGAAARRTVVAHGWDACATATAAIYEQVARTRRDA